MNSKVQSALMAGVLLGVTLVIIVVVSSLSPALGKLGCCACLLPIGAGLFAANNFVGKSSTPVAVGDGAVLGAIAGLVGGLIYLVIGVPLSYFVNPLSVDMAMEQLRSTGVNLPFSGFVLVMVLGVIGVVIHVILSTIGGLIGVAIFEKRKDGAGAPPPPPPPAGGYGGPTTGGGSFGQGS